MSTDTILRQKIYLEKILMSKWDMFQDKRNNIVFKVETQQIKTRPTCFTSGASGKESACQCRMCGEVGFDLWVWKIPWRRKWQPTPVFLPGKSQGQRSLEGYSPWGHKGSDTSAHTQHNILHMRCLFIFGNKEFNFFFFFFATLQGLWDLISPTRD